MGTVTIRDVARLANVSSATVSHVFNKTRFVSPEKTEQVLKAAKELNYTPNAYAKSFRTGKKNLIGFIVPDISNRFFATIIEAVETTLSQYNYKLIVANTKETGTRELEHLSYFCSGVVDGLLIASTFKNYSDISKYLNPNLPVLFVDRKFDNMPWCSATITNTDATYCATSDLIQSGHTKIGYVAGIPHLSTTKGRINGYLSAMRDAGIEVQESWITYGNSMKTSAEGCVQKLLQENCTALIISNGVMSLDVANYLYRMKKTVPAVYFDDDYKLDMAPCFATISQPSYELGKTAAEQIMCLIDNPNQQNYHIILSGTYNRFK
ncbi:LacI family DNA-binding transcriptional regulator [Agathobaculum sp. NSJ-28]|uniref:LacI family DNA-binding transcriptional regulator n=1 Tax=Agathobaculum faecis TaxID=2763013 RepID=A0A923LXP8_9FIRM|nr:MULTISPECIES: LacI family DNA-binding transcriptional regulator [Agathobaculum]MBC5726212.1 LacI family DNA-binding transcriptional regulator [Agathobaculum faecis]